MNALSDKQFFMVAAAGLGLGYLLIYSARGAVIAAGEAAGDAAQAVGGAVNPTSRDNIFYKGVNAIGDIFDDGGDNDSFSLGSWAYDWVHGE